MEMCFDALMARALDEPDAVYGLIADGVDDFGRPQQFRIFAAGPKRVSTTARRSPPQDAAFTFKLYKDKGHPDLSLSLTHLR